MSSVKILVTALGQHLIADVKQVEDNETKAILAYWLTEPRVIHYHVDTEKENVSIRFLDYVAVATDKSFSVAAHHITSILSPREDVLTAYTAHVYPETEAPAETAVLEAPAEAPAEETEVAVEG